MRQTRSISRARPARPARSARLPRPAKSAPSPAGATAPSEALAATARRRILDAAVVEFAARGFEGASSNTIAREAGVAKGLVFHYFGSKADLYLAVFDDVTTRLGEQVVGEGLAHGDLLERLRIIALRKVHALQRDPIAFRFVLASLDAPPPLRAEIELRTSAMRERMWSQVLRSLEGSRLRPGLTIEQAIETLSILAEGLDRRYSCQLSRMQGRTPAQLAALTEEVWSHYARLFDGLYEPGAVRAPSSEAIAEISAATAAAMAAAEPAATEIAAPASRRPRAAR